MIWSARMILRGSGSGAPRLLELPVDDLRGLAAEADRLGRDAEAHGDVAAGEDARDRSLVDLVDVDPALLAAELLDAGPDRRLADAGDDHGAGHLVVRTGDGDRTAAAAGVGLAELHALALHRDGAAVLDDDLERRRQELVGHALVLGLGDLVLDRRHLLAGAPVEQRHVRAEAARGARGVDRGVAAADDDDLVADVDLLADPDALQEVDAGEAVRRVLALEAEVDALLGADRQVHGLVVAPQVLHRDVAADLHVRAQLDARGRGSPGSRRRARRRAGGSSGCRSAACRRPWRRPRTPSRRSRGAPAGRRRRGRRGRRRRPRPSPAASRRRVSSRAACA